MTVKLVTSQNLIFKIEQGRLKTTFFDLKILLLRQTEQISFY